MFSNLLNSIGNHNPQLLREIKGKMTPTKVFYTIAISLVSQYILFFSFVSKLPHHYDFFGSFFNRYCTGNYNQQSQASECVKNLAGELNIHWELWWLDMFFGLSITGVFILLLVGIYLLIIDLIQENKKGTLNFIRLSPITTKDFFTGKMLGVPSLALLFVGLAIPLHFCAGLHSNIGIGLVLAFYILVGLSCAFFYSLALLFASLIRNYPIFSAFLATVIIFALLTTTTPYFNPHGFGSSSVDLVAFNPLIFLTYLIEATNIPVEVSDYSLGNFHNTLWYGKPIWSISGGIVFTLSLNYIWWTYILHKGLKRVHNTPKSTIFTKLDSYLITGSWVFIWFGFIQLNDSSQALIMDKVFYFQLSLSVVFFLLIASITPNRQTLLDWSRYRHHNSKNILKDLIVGEKSPSVVAMILNSLLVLSYLVMPLALYLLEEDKVSGLLSLISQMTTLCIFAFIVQLVLMLRVRREGTVLAFTLFLLTFSSMLIMRFLYLITGTFLYISPVPIPGTNLDWLGFGLTLILESLVLGSLSLVMQKQLRKFGESETKALLG